MRHITLKTALEPAVKQAPFCCPEINHNERNWHMEQTIREMILQADDERNLDLICCVKEILDEFSSTRNCPLDWQRIGAVLADEYPAGSWVYENLGLCNFTEISDA